jgi:hypothetical protein
VAIAVIVSTDAERTVAGMKCWVRFEQEDTGLDIETAAFSLHSLAD